MSSEISKLSQSTSFSGGQSKIEDELKSLGVPSDVIAKGPDAVKTYCEENNISMPKPPEKPQDSSSIFSSASSSSADKTSGEDEAPPELEAELLTLGVPAETIAEGREAVMTYCKENNITLPEPPQNNSAGATEEVGQKLDSYW